LGRVELVTPGVLIGMVKGGPVDVVGGFGFPSGSLGVDSRAIGLARAKLDARPDKQAEPKPDVPVRARKPKAKSRRARPVRAKAGRKAKSGKVAAQPGPVRVANAAKQPEPGEATAHG
jgi:hypothetical protein